MGHPPENSEERPAPPHGGVDDPFQGITPWSDDSQAAAQAAVQAAATATPQADQQPQTGQANQSPQLVVTETVVLPDQPISSTQTSMEVGFGVGQMDSNGHVTVPEGKHDLTMTETLNSEESKGPKPQICASGCTNTLAPTHKAEDTMTVSKNQTVVLNKTFQIDGKAAKVYDTGSGRTHDFVHQQSNYKGHSGTVLTFGDADTGP